MAPAPAPAEIDVFSGPHSRMKRLVQLYSEKLSEVDLSSCADLRALLWSLKSTFTEFKTHEHIENECIMWRLKNRLQFLKVEITAVSEVHSDNKLSEMVQLVEEGCTQADRCNCPKEAANIGSNLITALRKFTEDFLPHMQEEEEIFQPLLMEYFSYSELKEIKSDVIKQHLQLTKYCPEEKENGESIEDDKDRDDTFITGHADTDLDDEELDENENALSKIQGLPAEVLLAILSYLNPKDLSQCSMVCIRWAGLARDPSLWKHLYPAQWARGDWQFGASLPHLAKDEDSYSGYESDVYVVVDEDADFDESASSAVESDSSNHDVASYRAECIRREARMLVAMARHLLPYIGEGVQTINLSKSKGVTNGLVYKLLTQCPNLQHLDLSETKVSDIAFKCLGQSGIGCNLRHLDLSGCTNISDLALKRLACIQQEREPHPTSDDQQNGCQNNQAHNANNESFMCNHTSDKNGQPLCLRTERTETEHSCFSGSPSSMVFANKSQRTVNRDSCHGVVSSSSAPRTRKFNHGSCTDSNKGSSCHGNKDDAGNDRNAGELHVERRLEFLSLSGCYRITDNGLRMLSQRGWWPHLRHLDMSGCLNVSAGGLSLLAGACPSLDHQEFFYCDNIEEGPYAETASGCQNLQCSSRVCCRSGE